MSGGDDMGYEISLKKAWDAFKEPDKEKECVHFLGDEYKIDFSQRTIVSMSCNIEAKDYYKILILHYLANEDKVLDIEKDAWKSFKQMEGGEAYFSAFRKRAIDPILRKYGDNPSAIFERMKTLNAEKIDTGNAGISIQVFQKIRVGIIIWAKDEEFGADCSMLFNQSIDRIFPTEDVAVLGGIVASLI